MLAAELLQPPAPSGQPPLALVHGFTQTGRSWGAVAAGLLRSRPVLLVDAPGHGRSADLRLDLWEAGRSVLEAAGDADLLGYSMGGRMCLHAALLDPGSRRRLVLVGATAGILDETVRRRRRAEDERLASTIEGGGDAGLPEFLDRWLAGPLFAGLTPEAAGRGARLENTAEGLASSLRLCGTGSQEPLDDRLVELAMPVLLVVGQHDAKFRAEAERLAAGLHQAEIATIEGAGHACHLERPDSFVEIVEGWLARTNPAGG